MRASGTQRNFQNPSGDAETDHKILIFCFGALRAAATQTKRGHVAKCGRFGLASDDIYCHNIRVVDVLVTEAAQQDFLALPLPIQARALQVFERLRRWPQVSGAKPLRGELKGAYRIRIGDWRVLFKVAIPRRQVTVFRIANRRDVYE